MNKKDVAFMVISAVVVFIAGIIANYYGSAYAIERASSPVADLILSNISTYDVDMAFVIGPMLTWLFFIILIVSRPRRIPFALMALGLLMAVRAVFVTLTHIGPFPGHISVAYNILGFFSTGGDLFFSGHTAMPFMMALIFWNNLPLRILFICASVFFGIVVLLGHLHYSIDVLAAFFITYTTYHIATMIFVRPKAVFDRGYHVI